ncbi:MAG: ABC transporter ATP-binding protein [Fusobacterium necrophorum]|nr:ABC transporter ATP-binding protein [Fusobacterium necrophorum]
MIEIRNLSYRKGKKQILKNISLSLPKNCIIGILGANGSGKTTLLRHLIRELPSHNEIYFDGMEINHISRKEFAKSLSFVPQNIVYIDEMTIEDVVKMGRYPYKKLFVNYSREDEKIVEESLRVFDLEELREKTIGTVSGGEAKRAFVAKAFAQKTEMVVLDEPINHLDIKHQLGLLKLFQEMKEKTILLSIHNIDLAFKFCDQIILMKNGEILAFGKTEEVLSSGNILEAFEVEVTIKEVEDEKRILYK